MNTYMANPDKIERKWYVVDAAGYTLGRLASEVAKVLRGKNKPEFTPHIDTGDYVIVVNAKDVKVTGKKMDQKIYYNHSDYVGGMRETTLAEMMAKKPEKVIELAVSLPAWGVWIEICGQYDVADYFWATHRMGNAASLKQTQSSGLLQ